MTDQGGVCHLRRSGECLTILSIKSSYYAENHSPPMTKPLYSVHDMHALASRLCCRCQAYSTIGLERGANSSHSLDVLSRCAVTA
jgi:hypothetical protein